MVGAATFYPFKDPSYQWPQNILDLLKEQLYPFASEKGMLLFGDYQFGGHRDFKEQLLFGPEDCSSAVGKATYLTNNQVRDINTTKMVAAYSNQNNEYNYKKVTCFEKGMTVREEQLILIQEGDIYLIQGHTAIIATKYDNKSNITTVQFNRDIESLDNKLLGGGKYEYNLIEEAKESTIYILRPNVKDLCESYNEVMFLSDKVDTRYDNWFHNDPTNQQGNCVEFYEDYKDTQVGVCNEYFS